MTKKVMLLCPFYEGWTGFHLGLASISSYLVSKGCETEIFDLTKDRLGNAEFASIHDFPEFVCMSCTTATYKSALDLASKIKAKNPTTAIVIGGPHVTYTPKETLENNPFIDIVVIGEGWKTIEELLQTRSLNQVLGIAYRERDEIKINRPRPKLDNLDLLPFPDRRYAQNYSIEHFGYGKKSTSVITSLGCTNRCGFCSASDYWGGIRARSIDNVIVELKQLAGLGFKNIYFEDDIFVFDRTRAQDMTNRILKEKLDIDWHIETRVDSVDERLLRTMADAGLKDIFFGIESGSESLLKNMGKCAKLEDGVRAFRLCKKYDVGTLAAIQIGYMGETEETIKKTIDYLHKIEPDKILLAITSIYPGTPLFNKLRIPNDVYEIDDLESPALRKWKVEHNNHGAGAIHPPFVTGLSSKAYSKRETFEKVYAGLSNFIIEKIYTIYHLFMDEFSDRMELPKAGG